MLLCVGGGFQYSRMNNAAMVETPDRTLSLMFWGYLNNAIVTGTYQNGSVEAGLTDIFNDLLRIIPPCFVLTAESPDLLNIP